MNGLLVSMLGRVVKVFTMGSLVDSQPFHSTLGNNDKLELVTCRAMKGFNPKHNALLISSSCRLWTRFHDHVFSVWRYSLQFLFFTFHIWSFIIFSTTFHINTAACWTWGDVTPIQYNNEKIVKPCQIWMFYFFHPPCYILEDYVYM